MRRSRDNNAEIGIARSRQLDPPAHVDSALIASVFDVLPETAFFIKDAGLRYVAVNQTMAALCGAGEKKALLGRRAADFFERGLFEHFEALDRQVLLCGEPIIDRLELVAALRAPPMWLLFSRFPLLDQRGRAAGVLGVARQLATPDIRHPKYARLAATTRTLRKQFTSPLRISELARSAGVSPSQLERDFRRVFGLSPQQFQHRVRIEQAMRLLKSSRPIAEIAHSCGFTDHSAFTRRFREATGLTPTAYREKERMNSALQNRSGSSPRDRF